MGFKVSQIGTAGSMAVLVLVLESMAANAGNEIQHWTWYGSDRREREQATSRETLRLLCLRRLRLSFLDGKSGKELSLGQNPVVRAFAKV